MCSEVIAVPTRSFLQGSTRKCTEIQLVPNVIHAEEEEAITALYVQEIKHKLKSIISLSERSTSPIMNIMISTQVLLGSIFKRKTFC